MTIFIRHYDRNWKAIAVIKIQNNDNLMVLLLCTIFPLFAPTCVIMFVKSEGPAAADTMTRTAASSQNVYTYHNPFICAFIGHVFLSVRV